MNKKTRPEQISRAIRIAEEVKIGFGGNFIFGDIAETHETFCESLEFIFKHCLDIHVNFGVVCPYPGSKLFEYAQARGIIRDKAAFYENIDKYIINLTAMRNEFWPSWIVKFSGIINQVSFIKATTAFRYENEPYDEHDPFQGNGVLMWRIWAHCPHCHTDVIYREPLSLDRIEQNCAHFMTGCPRCHKRIRVQVHADVRKQLESMPIIGKRSFCDGRAEEPEQLKQRIYDAFKDHLVDLIGKKNCSKVVALKSREPVRAAG